MEILDKIEDVEKQFGLSIVNTSADTVIAVVRIFDQMYDENGKQLSLHLLHNEITEDSFKSVCSFYKKKSDELLELCFDKYDEERRFHLLWWYFCFVSIIHSTNNGDEEQD